MDHLLLKVHIFIQYSVFGDHVFLLITYFLSMMELGGYICFFGDHPLTSCYNPGK